MRRPKFLILVSALLLALVIIFWPGRLPEPRDESKPTPQPPPAPLLSDLGKPAQLYRVAPASPGRVYEIDPANEQRADMLNSPDQGVQEDLQIVSEFVDLIHKAGVNASFGDNADITAPVASYFPNDFGLYCMNGNVAEWLQEPDMAAGGSWRDVCADIRNESVATATGPAPRHARRTRP